MNKVDLAGKRYGRLLVVGPATPLHHPKGQTTKRWKCLCDCGTTTLVTHSGLRSKGTQSCGCFRSERARQPRLKERITGTAGMTRYKNYRKSAGLEGREFEISYEEFLEITQLVCFYCGAEPRNKFKARFEEFIYNGMDRIENSLGYTKENVVPCCWRCNRMKGPLSASEFISQCKKIWEYSHG